MGAPRRRGRRRRRPDDPGRAPAAGRRDVRARPIADGCGPADCDSPADRCGPGCGRSLCERAEARRADGGGGASRRARGRERARRRAQRRLRLRRHGRAAFDRQARAHRGGCAPLPTADAHGRGGRQPPRGGQPGDGYWHRPRVRGRRDLRRGGRSPRGRHGRGARRDGRLHGRAGRHGRDGRHPLRRRGQRRALLRGRAGLCPGRARDELCRAARRA